MGTFRCTCGHFFADAFEACPRCDKAVDLDHDQLRDLEAERAEDEEDLQDMRAERGDGLTRRNGRP
jgi:hypothetical protein